MMSWDLSTVGKKGTAGYGKGRVWKEGMRSREKTHIASLQLLPRLDCLAPGGDLHSISGSLRQLCISCWNELEIKIQSLQGL
jgi:hypothetical protein